MTEPEPACDQPLDVRDPHVRAAIDRYWTRNLMVMGVLLAIWALTGYVLPIFLAESLDGVMWGGFPLSFWLFQQGSTLSFVLLILIYAAVMNALDRAHHRDLARRPRAATSRTSEV